MGIFDKLKKVGNFLSGGGAKLDIVLDQQIYQASEPLKILVRCQVEGDDLDMKKAYLKVRATEHVSVKGVEKAVKQSDGVVARKQDVRDSHHTYQQEYTLAPAQTLGANELYEWSFEVILPSHVEGSYMGVNARHEWQVYAGIDTRGNDPDSGWKTVEIRK